MAYISGDENLIAISEDPNRDVHSETAAASFGIKVPEGELLADYIKTNHNHARSSAKIVLFGGGLFGGLEPSATVMLWIISAELSENG